MTNELNKMRADALVECAAMTTVIVYGPQACGKTRNARAIADALGLPDILDDWHQRMPAPTTKTLVLTNETGPFQQFTRRALSFEQAMSLVASKKEAAA